jgi:hypothetical protein
MFKYGKCWLFFILKLFAQISEMGFLFREKTQKGRSFYSRNSKYLAHPSQKTLCPFLFSKISPKSNFENYVRDDNLLNAIWKTMTAKSQRNFVTSDFLSPLPFFKPK